MRGRPTRQHGTSTSSPGDKARAGVGNGQEGPKKPPIFPTRLIWLGGKLVLTSKDRKGSLSLTERRLTQGQSFLEQCHIYPVCLDKNVACFFWSPRGINGLTSLSLRIPMALKASLKDTQIRSWTSPSRPEQAEFRWFRGERGRLFGALFCCVDDGWRDPAEVRVSHHGKKVTVESKRVTKAALRPLPGMDKIGNAWY